MKRSTTRIIWTVCCGVLTAVALILSVAHWLQVRTETAQLLRTWPEEIPANKRLNSFAMARGRTAFVRHCAQCHGNAGQPDTAHGVPDLRDRDWLYGSGRVEEIERIISYGIRSGNSKGSNLASMPAFATPNPYSRYATPSLTPQELDDVTEYLYSVQHPDADADAAMRGKRVFEDRSRGLCWDCHGGLGQGDPSIGAPNLRDRVWLYGDGSRHSIYASIAHGRAGVCPGWISKLSPVTIVALAVYTRSLSQPALNNSSE